MTALQALALVVKLVAIWEIFMRQLFGFCLFAVIAIGQPAHAQNIPSQLPFPIPNVAVYNQIVSQAAAAALEDLKKLHSALLAPVGTPDYDRRVCLAMGKMTNSVVTMASWGATGPSTKARINLIQLRVLPLVRHLSTFCGVQPNQDGNQPPLPPLRFPNDIIVRLMNPDGLKSMLELIEMQRVL